MAKSPSFQFYASDFLTDTQSWDICEVGIYIRLLSNQWVNESLPKDLKRLSRIAGCDHEELKKAWVILGIKFLENEEGGLYNGKLEEVRAQQAAYREKQSLNGSMGGRPKKDKPKLNPEETQTKPKDNPNPNPNKSTSTSTSNKENIIKEFDLFWNKYPNKVAKEKCRGKFLVLPDSDRKKILETVEAFVRYSPFDGYHHPNPDTYLNQKRWQDPIPTEVLTQKPKGATDQSQNTNLFGP